MPGMNGLEFLEELRADRALRSLPVVVLTTSNQESDRAAAYDKNVAGSATVADVVGEGDADIAVAGADVVATRPDAVASEQNRHIGAAASCHEAHAAYVVYVSVAYEMTRCRQRRWTYGFQRWQANSTPTAPTTPGASAAPRAGWSRTRFRPGRALGIGHS